MDKIHMKIHAINNIDDFEFDIPNKKGLYALTGENGAGKSTILSCAANAFYQVYLNNFFGKPRKGAFISFSFGDKRRVIKEKNGKWDRPNKNTQNLGITGFYEGSIVFGNRFKDVDESDLSKMNDFEEKDLFSASGFVKKTLGSILHDDENYYSELFELNGKVAKKHGLQRSSYFYKNKGCLVNQLNMSTGENLLLTVLNSIERRLKKNIYGETPSFIFLDEIELALHSSALKRLVYLFKKIADDSNIVILFSTHSIELIRSISPENIFYLQMHKNDKLEIINPCYPVYATRYLEASEYGYDFIILVEDNLAKKIVDKILLKERLLDNKRVLVIAVGGWHQVLRFASDTIRSNLAERPTNILIVLDRDIKGEVPSFMKNERIGFNGILDYLPIKSLEKFLLDKLIDNLDETLFRDLNNYIFQNRSLDSIIEEYNTGVKNKDFKNLEEIKNGKILYRMLHKELERIRKNDSELVEFIVDYLFNNVALNPEIKELSTFLKNKFSYK